MPLLTSTIIRSSYKLFAKPDTTLKESTKVFQGDVYSTFNLC